ncbi:MAG: SDR family oxidoreductase [Proteobacteria bacterium]|nr:SDR family oxidoreductase [Pseudomonadota bacterium]
MRHSSRTLGGKSVVITGASSGIGRAAALAFARRGARVTLAARRGELLQDLAVECRRLGGEAIAAPTDVTDAAAVRALAGAAQAAFGGVDVWINNAGTGVFGPFADTPLELHRRTIEVDLLGALYGAHAVLPLFLRQGRGVLINNISVGGWSPAPYAAAYTAAKFGLRGLTASLRQEMQLHHGIHVCAVFPAMIDTPGIQHGANTSGGAIDPGLLLYAPEDVAETFVRLALRPRAEVGVGWPARAAQMGYVLARGPTERITGFILRRAMERADPAPRTGGNLLAPVPEGAEVSGGWRARKRVPSARTVNAAALGAAVAVAGAATLLRARRRG